MIVDHDHIEGETGLLRYRALYRIANRLHSIAYRDHDAGLHRKCVLGAGQRFERWLEVSTNAFQVIGHNLFHLDLVRAATGIHIVELALAGIAQVSLRPDVEWLGDSHN